ncbi:S-adenosyl-L-methionine-dependent methyltransferase [Mycena polygramma]|nr:S-adenosyl-L-methionine-dependent methyltransferase [Mycena polygramma]
MSSVHPLSQAGFAQGTNELYNKARPQSPPEVLSHLRRAIKSSGPLNVVEIGSGTGLSTRALLAHEEWTDIRNLKAIDPSKGMREVFAKYTTDDRVVVSEGTFDNTGVESNWADLIVIVQAFHWCLDYEAAAAEFARILKPGGVLALIWNNEDRDAALWLQQVRQLVERNGKEDAPSGRSGLWRQIFDTPSYIKFFAPPEEATFPFIVPGTLDSIINRGLSISRITVLTDAGKEAFVKDAQAIVERGEGKVWIEEEKGTFEVPRRTEIVIARRL